MTGRHLNSDSPKEIGFDLDTKPANDPHKESTLETDLCSVLRLGHHIKNKLLLLVCWAALPVAEGRLPFNNVTL